MPYQGFMKSKQYPATNPNWTKVKVMGNLNCSMIDLPVFDDMAEDRYHREQSRMNSAVDGLASVVVGGGVAGLAKLCRRGEGDCEGIHLLANDVMSDGFSVRSTFGSISWRQSFLMILKYN